jgi:hypothetical protein
MTNEQRERLLEQIRQSPDGPNWDALLNLANFQEVFRYQKGDRTTAFGLMSLEDGQASLYVDNTYPGGLEKHSCLFRVTGG